MRLAALDRCGRHDLQLVLVEGAPRTLDRLDQGFLVGEVAEQRDDVGKTLVECRNVLIGLLGEVAADAVDDRVRRLVNHDVVRQAGEDGLPRQVAPRILAVGAEVAEEDAVRVRAVEGVGGHHRMREDVERADVDRAAALDVFPAAPVDAPAERRFEVLDGVGDYRVDHLLVEPRIGLGGVEAAADEDARIVEVNRRVPGLVGAVVVDDGDGITAVVAHHRTAVELLVAHVDAHLVSQQPPLAGIKSVGLERSRYGSLEVRRGRGRGDRLRGSGHGSRLARFVIASALRRLGHVDPSRFLQ